MRIGRTAVLVAMALLVVTACTDEAEVTTTTDGATSGPATTSAGDADPLGDATPTTEAPDPLAWADVGYVDNLLAKEAAGEWTREEGLVATLSLLAGEADRSDVLVDEELVEHEATGILAMARDHVAATGSVELERLLDDLTYTSEELEAMASTGQAAAGAFLGASLQTTDCTAFFHGQSPPGVGPCLEEREVQIPGAPGPGPYRMFVPLGDDTGWTEADHQLAIDAMIETVEAFATLESPATPMPPVDLVFSVGQLDQASAQAFPVPGQPCGVALYTELQKPEYSDDDVKQIIAHELAHCFQTERFPGQNSVPYEHIRWREEGVAQLLSNFVYPTNDLEWDPGRMANLAKGELATTLFDRSYSNHVFFQHLVSYHGAPAAVFALIDGLPTSGGMAEQRAAMAAIPAAFEVHEDYARTTTDEEVVDTGGAFGPFPMTEDNQPTSDLTGPTTVVATTLRPFGLDRGHLRIPDGRQACLSWDQAGITAEYRTEPDGDWAPLPILVPEEPDASGDIVYVATSREDRPFALVVESVHDFDEDTDGELVGTWVVDNASLAEDLDYLAPVQTVDGVSGTITVTFRADGSVDLAYDSFRVSGFSDVELEQEFADGTLFADFFRTWSSTIDASGTDGWELTEDRSMVFFDSLSESDFLTGVDTVRETHRGTFFGMELDERELEVELPSEQVDERDPIGWGILGAASFVEFRCGGNVLLLDDVRLRRVG